MPLRLAFFLAAALLGLAGCAQNEIEVSGGTPDAGIAGAQSQRAASRARPVVHAAAEAPVAGQPNVLGWRAEIDGEDRYFLDTGDKLRIFVYGQPNLSRLYTVDHSGKITVPLIGAVGARGLTTVGLEREIRRRLGERFVRDPQVTVDVSQNRPFFILGEVRTPGQYPYVSSMTVETAVAIAGGYTERASDKTFRISRRGGGSVVQIEVPAQYILQPGDTVFVYERFL